MLDDDIFEEQWVPERRPEPWKGSAESKRVNQSRYVQFLS
jgi:hypothetical protein